MPSITSWTRIEPKVTPDIERGLQARIHDPLWLLKRQLELGEFKGEDGGSPIIAELKASRSSIVGYTPGASSKRGEENDDNTSTYPYNIDVIPLETLVERENGFNENSIDLRFGAESGLHFLRIIESHGLSAYRSDYVYYYPISDELKDAIKISDSDNDSLRFLSIMVNRVPNGYKLYNDFIATLRPSDGRAVSLPERPQIAEPDRVNLIQAANEWLEWYESLLSKPQGKGISSWSPQRMEYQFGISSEDSESKVFLSASEYIGGRLDWFSFDLSKVISKEGSFDEVTTEETAHTLIPSPLYYKGMPNTRWWQFEDAQVNFGSIESGTDDLARLLLIEFAITYGNDWYVLPISLPIGSIYKIKSLIVTDTFGQRLNIKHSSETFTDRNSSWQMFTLSPHLTNNDIALSGPNNSYKGLLFLPPLVSQILTSKPIEEVLFARDEMSNLAWAVEHTVENALGLPINRFEELEKKQRQNQEQNNQDPSNTSSIVYRLTSDNIPENWFPLVPVGAGYRDMKLQRRYMPQVTSNGSILPIYPQGKILQPRQNLEIYEEEIPRTGVSVIRKYQYSRWIDGSTHLWISRQKRPGKGEAYSGLRFDAVKPFG